MKEKKAKVEMRKNRNEKEKREMTKQFGVCCQ